MLTVCLDTTMGKVKLAIRVSPIKKVCGLKNSIDFWQTTGHFDLPGPGTQLETFQTGAEELKVSTDEDEICTIDLTSCKPWWPEGSRCFCTKYQEQFGLHQVLLSQIYLFNISGVARLADSNKIFRVSYSDDDNSIVQPGGRLPTVYAKMIATYEINEKDQGVLKQHQTVEAPPEVSLTFCLRQLLRPRITLNKEILTGDKECFSKSYSPPQTVILEYEETEGCKRKGKFTVELQKESSAPRLLTTTTGLAVSLCLLIANSL